MTIINLVSPNRRVAIARNPDTSEVVGMNLILDKLALTIFMDVNPSCLSMMNFTVHNGWICSGLYFEASNPVIVNIVGLKISLRNINYS